jgi:signal transduction histidine kinase
MNPSEWRWIKGMRGLLAMPRPEPARQAERIVKVQCNIVLPVKAGLIAVVLSYLFVPGWFSADSNMNWVVHQVVKSFFFLYVLCNVVIGSLILFWRRFPAGMLQWLAFAMGLLDGLFVSGLVLITGGFGSMGYWVFPGLIVLNAISIPLATPQIVLNLLLSAFYLTAGFAYANPDVRAKLFPIYVPETPGRTNVATASLPTDGVTATNSSLTLDDGTGTNVPPTVLHLRLAQTASDSPSDETSEPFLLHASVLWLLTACCYGVQLLVERQRRTMEEEREFAAREAQLRTAGRLAAEIAHQIKNPLAIINNTVFSLQRSSKERKPPTAAQIQMIQEEIGRADQILTDLMGYAQLAEGRVEKLNVTEELDRAIEEVFPPAAAFKVRIERRYEPYFPPLMMQRRHLSGVFVNLLQNAREAMNGNGTVTVMAQCRADYSVEVAIADTGPGIPPDKLGIIFDAYFTTKQKGTGLGLAVVKHNVELYGGTVHVESELGKGTRFVLAFPAKSVINLSRKNRERS